MLTFGEAKDAQELSEISGACPQSETFRTYLNQATRMLMRRGNYFGTVQKIRVCVYGNEFVWPRYVGTPISVSICGAKLQSTNFWTEFLPVTPGDWQWSSDFRGDPCAGNAKFEHIGPTPIMADVPCNKNFYLRAYPSTREDIGKTTYVFGTDSAGQEIRSKQSDGTWIDGLKLSLQVPYVGTPITIRNVSRLLKEKTSGPVRYYFYDADNDALWDCATYAPHDLSPSFEKCRLRNFYQNRTAQPTTTIRALVKLKFIPVVDDTDPVLIENLDALQMMMFACKFAVQGDVAQKRSLEVEAVRELNYQLRDKFPIEQFLSSFNPFGTAKLERVTGGFI